MQFTQHETFRAVVVTVVPEAAQLSAEGWRALEAAVERTLAARPALVRRQLASLLQLIELLPLVMVRRRFSRCTPEQRTQALTALEHAPLLVLRRGLWGLRTLVFLGYYTQPEVQTALGYRAHPDGWSLVRRSGEHAAIVANGESNA